MALLDMRLRPTAARILLGNGLSQDRRSSSGIVRSADRAAIASEAVLVSSPMERSRWLSSWSDLEPPLSFRVGGVWRCRHGVVPDRTARNRQIRILQDRGRSIPNTIVRQSVTGRRFAPAGARQLFSRRATRTAEQSDTRVRLA